MRLLRLTEGYENRNKVVRYFAVPRTYDRLFKILDSYRFKTGKITLGNFNNRPELNIRKYVPTEYKDAMGAELTRSELAKIPLKSVLDFGFCVRVALRQYHHYASLYLDFDIVDFDEEYERLTQEYATKLCDVPITDAAYNLVIHSFKVGYGDLPVDSIYNLEKYLYRSGEEKPEHFYSNDGNEVVRNALPEVVYFIEHYGIRQNAEFDFKLVDNTPHLYGRAEYSRYAERKLIKVLQSQEPLEIRSVESSWNLNNKDPRFQPTSPCVLYIDTEKSYRLRLQREYEREIRLLQGYRKAL